MSMWSGFVPKDPQTTKPPPSDEGDGEDPEGSQKLVPTEMTLAQARRMQAGKITPILKPPPSTSIPSAAAGTMDPERFHLSRQGCVDNDALISEATGGQVLTCAELKDSLHTYALDCHTELPEFGVRRVKSAAMACPVTCNTCSESSGGGGDDAYVGPYSTAAGGFVSTPARDTISAFDGQWGALGGIGSFYADLKDLIGYMEGAVLKLVILCDNVDGVPCHRWRHMPAPGGDVAYDIWAHWYDGTTVSLAGHKPPTLADEFAAAGAATRAADAAAAAAAAAESVASNASNVTNASTPTKRASSAPGFYARFTKVGRSLGDPAPLHRTSPAANRSGGSRRGEVVSLAANASSADASRARGSGRPRAPSAVGASAARAAGAGASSWGERQWGRDAGR